MTEREIEARLRNERISLPDGFEARQEAALRRVMAKRECVLPKRMAWLAAALALMMSAAAIAAGGRGLAFFWRQASPEAEQLIEKGIAQSGGQLDAAEFVVREAVYDGSVLQAVVAVQGKENRRAVMLGDDGNVSADAVLVDVGEDGEIETAREEDGVAAVGAVSVGGIGKPLVGWCTSDRRCGRRKRSFTWFGRALHPWRTRMA